MRWLPVVMFTSSGQELFNTGSKDQGTHGKRFWRARVDRCELHEHEPTVHGSTMSKTLQKGWNKRELGCVRISKGVWILPLKQHIDRRPRCENLPWSALAMVECVSSHPGEKQIHGFCLGVQLSWRDKHGQVDQLITPRQVLCPFLRGDLPRNEIDHSEILTNA